MDPTGLLNLSADLVIKSQDARLPDPPSDLPSFVVFHCCSEGFFSFPVFQLISKVKSEASKEGGDSDYLQHFSFQQNRLFGNSNIFLCHSNIFMHV